LVGARSRQAGRREVLYYWHVPEHHVYLIYGYAKSKREDLTPPQLKVLAEADEGCERWIRSISINWSRVCAR
jgi:hypothetical protein